MDKKEYLVVNNFCCKSNESFLKEVQKLNPEGNFLLKKNHILLYKGIKGDIKLPSGYLLKGTYVASSTSPNAIRLKRVPFLPRK
mgnify:CR=1 FL=1